MPASSILFSPDRQEQEACRRSTELGRPVARPSLSRRRRRYGSKGSRTSIGGSVVCVVAHALLDPIRTTPWNGSIDASGIPDRMCPARRAVVVDGDGDAL
jgi:hypothetical protein